MSILYLVTFLYFCCFLPVRLVSHALDKRPDIWDFLLYTAVGFGLCSLYSLLLLASGVNGVGWLVLPGVFTLYRIIRDPRIGKIKAGIDRPLTFCSLLLAFFCYSHLILWQTAIMGLGEYPEFFYNVDTAYYYGQVHSLVKATSYPPASLSNINYLNGYHYGAQNMAAIIVKMTAMPAHKSLFWVVSPMLLLATFAAVVRISKKHITTIPHAVFCLLVLLSPIFTSSLLRKMSLFLENGQVNSLMKVWKVWQNPQTFQHGFPMLGTQLATLLFFSIVGCLLSFEEKRSKIFYIICFSILIVAKTPWYVGVGCGVVIFALYRLLFFHEASVIIYSAIVLLITVCIHLLLPAGQGRLLEMSPGYYFMFLGDAKHVTNYPLNFDIKVFIDGFVVFIKLYSIPVFLSLTAYMFRTKKRDYNKEIVFFICFIIGPVIFTNIFVLLDVRLINKITMNTDLRQVCSPLIYSFGFLFVFILAAIEMKKKTVDSALKIFLIIVFLILPVSHLSLLTLKFSRNKKTGHEYVDNRMIADILKTIPEDGTIIVTNDFRYPANNYKRDFLQLQIPAVFGHQCYACNFKYQIYEESEARLEKQMVLRRSKWDSDVRNYAVEEGWTHYLVHKNYPHPSNISCQKVSENNSYIVYDLRSDCY